MKINKNNNLYLGIFTILITLFLLVLVSKDNINTNFSNNFEYSKLLLNTTTDILKDNNIIYWLDYGTCLGAFRNKDFIKYDTDIDISVCKHNLKKLKEVLSNDKLLEKNLKIVRDTNNIISLKLAKYNGIDTDDNVKGNPDDDIYIDIYLVDYLPKLDDIIFKETNHKIPSNTSKYLEHIYGNTWDKPMKGKHAKLILWDNVKHLDYFKKNATKCK